jgi:crotonobetainyl-CoA:carnitine CoA-transferase CaiB-like acyl-CoA transferase
MDAQAALQDLLKLAGRDPTRDDAVVISGEDPVLPTNYLLGTAGAVAIAAIGVAASDLWSMRTGRRQRVAVDMRAAAAALRSDRYLSIDGKAPPSPWDPISGFYRTRDERWIQFHCNFPHRRDGVLAFLRCANERAAVEAAAATWAGQALEDGLTEAQMCVGLVRSREEWLAHPHARAGVQLPLFEVIKIGDSPPVPLNAGARPLSGVRVLDLTRVIAGPVGGRTLAEHGAEVMRIKAPHLPGNFPLDIDTGHGKLSARLDLRRAADAERLRRLVQRADVFSQGYRPATLTSRGFSPEALAELRPGLVYVSLSAHGHQGPWHLKRGFDSLVQSSAASFMRKAGGKTSASAGPGLRLCLGPSHGIRGHGGIGPPRPGGGQLPGAGVAVPDGVLDPPAWQARKWRRWQDTPGPAARKYPGSADRTRDALWTAATCGAGSAVAGDASPLGATDSSVRLSRARVAGIDQQ